MSEGLQLRSGKHSANRQWPLIGALMTGALLSSYRKKLTRRERLKSALYLRLKKRKTFFFGKKLEIFEKISFGKCRTVPKNVKGGTLFDL